MTEQPAPNNGTNGLRLAWGRAAIEARGPIAIQLVILLAIFGNSAALVYGSREIAKSNVSVAEKISGSMKDTFDTFLDQHGSLARDISGLNGNDRILACILSLSPAVRDDLRQRQSVYWDVICPGIMNSMDQDRDGNRRVQRRPGRPG